MATYNIHNTTEEIKRNCNFKNMNPQVTELLEVPGNNVCVDCRSPDPAFMSCKLGVFLCHQCATIHQYLGPDFEKIKTLQDKWTFEEIHILKIMGNVKSREIYEKHVPACYKRPTCRDAPTLIEQWIRAKYERREFVEGAKHPAYMSGQMEGTLWKRGKNDKHFKRRRFILDCAAHQSTLKYYNKESAKDPKHVIRVNELNVVLAPEKIGHPNGLHILFTKDDYTRSLYLYADTGQEAVDWYTALRSAKLNRLAIAFPGSPLEELCGMLCVEHIKEGWLMKAGPRPNDVYRRRWMSLDKRKLLYYEDPLSPFPKGEVYIGTSDAYAVSAGTLTEYAIVLRTPSRIYHLSADSEVDRDEWIAAIKVVIGTPLAPHDRATPIRPKRTPTVRDSILKIIKPQ